MGNTTENVATLGVDFAKERRSMRWVDPKFQWRYSILLISIVLLISAVLIGTFWFHSEQVLRTLVSAGVVKQHALYLLVERQMHQLMISVFVVVALFSTFIFVMALFLSHRIVGPIVAIRRSLEFISQGDYQSARLKLRQDDEFQDVAELVNSTVSQLERKK